MKIINIAFIARLYNDSSDFTVDDFCFKVKEVEEIKALKNILIYFDKDVAFDLINLNKLSVLSAKGNFGRCTYINGTFFLIYYGQTEEHIKNILHKTLKGKFKKCLTPMI